MPFAFRREMPKYDKNGKALPSAFNTIQSWTGSEWVDDPFKTRAALYKNEHDAKIQGPNGGYFPIKVNRKGLHF